MTQGGTEQHLDKAKHYCSYQERCIKEVRQKLRAWRVPAAEEDKIIGNLEEEGFIDEKRFAREYAMGKFRNNGWGTHKIRFELTRKEIPPEFITLAISELEEEEDMDDQILRLLEKKSREIKAVKPYERKQKLIRFALSRGFRMDKILSVIDHHSEQLLGDPH